MLTKRIDNRLLSQLCERVGVAFDVGLDPHRVFEREAENSGAQYGRRMRAVADHVRKGNTLADAIKAQGNYFPPHFADMIEGGEKSGKLNRVLDRSAEYYEQLAEFRSIFRGAILWPMVQLFLATLIVGLIIYLPSIMLEDAAQEQKDLIGIGLIGAEGVFVYAIFVAVVATIIGFSIYLIRNGYLSWMFEWAAYLPVLGKSIRVFAEARFVQTLSLAIESGVDAATAIDLSFRSAGTKLFQSRADGAKVAINQGRDIHSVLADTKLFQPETLEVVQLGETSGKLSEVLDKHFRHLKVQVRSAMATLTYFLSSLIWLAIAALLIFIIFRVFSLYVDQLSEAASSTIGTATIGGETP